MTEPVQPVYIICFPQGACGHFLMAILERVLRPDEQVPMWTTTYNGAQSACMRPGFDFDWLAFEGRQITGTDFFENVILVVPDSEPVIIGFQTLDYDAMFKRFPQSKIIVVGFTADDIVEIGKNHFWQLFVDDFSSQRHFDELREKYQYLFTSPAGTRPEDLTTKEKEVVYNLLGGMALLTGYGEFETPAQRKDNVFCIQYRDLMYDAEKTLAELVKITGIETTDFVRTEYLNHLDKHKVFLETVV
jgi:hypothetical protein